MAESTMTTKGRTTVPVEVRDRIGAGPGTRLIWHVMPDESLIVRAKTRSIAELAGMLEAPKGRHVAVEETNIWRTRPWTR